MAAGGEGLGGAAERASAGAGRRADFKPKQSKEQEAARRRAALAAQQSEARASRITDVRRIAMEALIGDQENDLEQEVEIESDEDELEEKVADDQDADMGSPARHKDNNKMRRLRKLTRTLFFARQMQAPDWMIEVPSDLSTNWMMMVRPEGDRVLLLSDGGRVEIRRKNGYVMERYTDSRMPRGLTMLDCICVEKPADATSVPEAQQAMETAVEASDIEEVEDAAAAAAADEKQADEAEAPMDADVEMSASATGGRGRGRGQASGYPSGNGKGSKKGRGKGGPPKPRKDRRYAVCDVLFWDGTDMVGADTECRMYWLSSRFSELPERCPRKARPLVLIPAVDVSAEAVSEAYHADVGYCKDSLHFMHRQAHYAIDTPITPLSLMWRDRNISRWVIDTPDERGEKLPEKQAVVLELRGGGYLRTADRAVVGQLSAESLDGILQDKSRHKQLIRCEVDSVDIANRAFVGLRPLNIVPARSRVWPDSWGRILFQHFHRKGLTNSISFDAVAQAAAGVPAR